MQAINNLLDVVVLHEMIMDLKVQNVFLIRRH